jgi:hypothetical protein
LLGGTERQFKIRILDYSFPDENQESTGKNGMARDNVQGAMDLEFAHDVRLKPL